MRLVRARVRDYRSVHDSGDIEIEEHKTLLVGVNEAGKTAILKAIEQIKAPSESEKFSALKDYPRSRYTEVQRGDRDPSDIAVVEAVFTLDATDKAAFAAVEPGIKDVTELVLTRYLDNRLTYDFGGVKMYGTYGDIEKDLLRLRAHLLKQGDTVEVVAALAKLTAGRHAVSPLRGTTATAFEQWLDSALPHIDENDTKEEQRYDSIKAHVLREAKTSAVFNALKPRIPLFVYYSTYFTVRPRIQLSSLAAREQNGDLDGEYDFGNLCLLRLLGLTAQELSDLAAGEPSQGNYGGRRRLTTRRWWSTSRSWTTGTTASTRPASISPRRSGRLGGTSMSSSGSCRTASTSRWSSSMTSGWRSS